MYLYGHKFKIIAIKGNTVDQSSCKSTYELIDEYQVYITVLKWSEARNVQQTEKNAWSD